MRLPNGLLWQRQTFDSSESRRAASHEPAQAPPSIRLSVFLAPKHKPDQKSRTIDKIARRRIRTSAPRSQREAFETWFREAWIPFLDVYAVREPEVSSTNKLTNAAGSSATVVPAVAKIATRRAIGRITRTFSRFGTDRVRQTGTSGVPRLRRVRVHVSRRCDTGCALAPSKFAGMKFDFLAVQNS